MPIWDVGAKMQATWLEAGAVEAQGSSDILCVFRKEDDSTAYRIVQVRGEKTETAQVSCTCASVRACACVCACACGCVLACLVEASVGSITTSSFHEFSI